MANVITRIQLCDEGIHGKDRHNVSLTTLVIKIT